MRQRKMLPETSETPEWGQDNDSFKRRLQRHVNHHRRASATSTTRTPKVTKKMKPSINSESGNIPHISQIARKPITGTKVDLEDWDGELWLRITDSDGRYSYIKRENATDLIRKVLLFVS